MEKCQSVKQDASLKRKHHHPEVSYAFQNLEENRFIKILDRNPGKREAMGKGRQQIYYKVTERGLRVSLKTMTRSWRK